MKLIDLKEGQEAVIQNVQGEGAFRKRLLEMGVIKGEVIKVVKKSPFKDPVEYKIMGYDVSLRNSEAKLIEVAQKSKKSSTNNGDYKKLLSDRVSKPKKINTSKLITVALVGNPNCGKTTIFNYTSKAKAKVGNYCGVTIESKEAYYKFKDYTFRIIDLPGTYSVSSYSPDELYVRDFLLEQDADVVLNVLDSSNLKRNLYLTTQLMDLNIEILGVLNMYDNVINDGNIIDTDTLEKALDIPFVTTVASRGKGIDAIFERLIDMHENKSSEIAHKHIDYGDVFEKEIQHIQKLIRENKNSPIRHKLSSRFIAVKLFERDKDAYEKIKEFKNGDEIESYLIDSIKRLEKHFENDTEAQITDTKYRFIISLLSDIIQKKSKPKLNLTARLDSVLTNKFLGFPIFLGFIWLTFYATFNLGEYPMGWIESGIEWMSYVVDSFVVDSMFKDFIIDGVLGGAGAVLVFLPNIVILYLFISLLEDTGYMSRAVFLMDKLMSKIGLNGKSFIPLLMGFGCNVPAIMSTRIIEGHRDRLITMLINPFMSCSARLTVYVLMITAFFTDHRALILFTLYMTGIIMAVVSALLFRKTFFNSSFIPIPFVMEFPKYKIPTLNNIYKSIKFSAGQYLKKVGGIILIASTIIWLLGYFPQNVEYSENHNHKIDSLRSELKLTLSEKNYSDEESKEIRQYYDEKIDIINKKKQVEKLEQSYIGQIGNFILPVMEPLGFDWKMSVAIVTGVAAKEVVIGTLGVLYQAEEETDNPELSLVNKMQNQTYVEGEKAGQKVFTKNVAFSFMIFILIYFPCIGVIAAIRKESGQKRWAVFSIVYPTVLAWVMAFLAYNIGKLFV
jgi:ferrous iron transport protein B